MNRFLILFFLLTLIACSKDRAKIARSEKLNFINKKLAAHKIDTNRYDIYLRAFKNERKLEVWSKNKADSIFSKIIEYDFCMLSGNLGPKRKSGDKQTPEGI